MVSLFAPKITPQIWKFSDDGWRPTNLGCSGAARLLNLSWRPVLEYNLELGPMSTLAMVGFSSFHKILPPLKWR